MTTVECDQLDSLQLSENALQNVEFKLPVPSTFAQFPLGFTLDAGGSVTKVVYRSKLDYTDGKPNNDVGDIVRLRFFANGKHEELMQFLKENCDIRQESSDKSNERPTYFQTGVNLQHYLTKLEEAFSCRIRLFSESKATLNSLLVLSEIIPQLKRSVPIQVEAMQSALEAVREGVKVMQSFKEAKIDVFADNESFVNSAEVQNYVIKLLTTGAAELADEFNAKPITFPCIFIQCGSATTTVLLHEDGKSSFGDFNPTAGKTILALARHLCGAKNFTELLHLASKGNRLKVDFLTGDLKNKAREETDWYSLMPETVSIFSLGKMSEEQFDGTYSKADIASALIYMHCNELARYGVLLARQNKVTSVVYAGSFCGWPMTQQMLQECFLKASLFKPMEGEQLPIQHILQNGGFLPALGTWHENVLHLEQNP